MTNFNILYISNIINKTTAANIDLKWGSNPSVMKIKTVVIGRLSNIFKTWALNASFKYGGSPEFDRPFFVRYPRAGSYRSRHGVRIETPSPLDGS
jgi:hypothetical protein